MVFLNTELSDFKDVLDVLSKNPDLLSFVSKALYFLPVIILCYFGFMFAYKFFIKKFIDDKHDCYDCMHQRHNEMISHISSFTVALEQFKSELTTLKNK